MRNWVKWNKFLLSAAFLSKVQRLYMFMNSFSVIFPSILSSNYQTIRSTSLFDIFIPIFFSTYLTQNYVKYLPLQHPDRSLKTRIRYFSQVGFIWISQSFYSSVFCFSALRDWSLAGSKLIFLLGKAFSFSKRGEFLYLCLRCGGRSLNINFFFDSSLLFQNIIYTKKPS